MAVEPPPLALAALPNALSFTFSAREVLPTAIVSLACACASLPIATPLAPPEVADVPSATASTFLQ